MMIGTMNELIIAERRINELEAENARLRAFRDAAKKHMTKQAFRIIELYAAEALEAANEPSDQQRAFENGVDAGKRLSSYGELPY